MYHLFVIRCKNRDRLIKEMTAYDIQVGVHYPVALPKLQAFKYLGIDCSNTFYGQSDSQLLSLPIGEHISKNEADKIVKTINRVI